MELLLAVAILVADVWAMVKTIQSPVTGGTKALWVLLIFLLPVLGLILWVFLGPRSVRG